MKIDLNLLDARDLLAKKEISSNELTKIYLDNIKKGEELTWDYGYTKGQVKDKTHPCFCGASKCRGVMY